MKGKRSKRNEQRKKHVDKARARRLRKKEADHHTAAQVERARVVAQNTQFNTKAWNGKSDIIDVVRPVERANKQFDRHLWSQQ